MSSASGAVPAGSATPATDGWKHSFFTTVSAWCAGSGVTKQLNWETYNFIKELTVREPRFLQHVRTGEWFIFRKNLCVCTDSGPGLVAYTRLTGTVAHEYAVAHTVLHEPVTPVRVGIHTVEA